MVLMPLCRTLSLVFMMYSSLSESWYVDADYCIPTPSLARTTSRATAVSATISVLARAGVSTNKISTTKRYTINCICTSFRASISSSRLRWIASLLQGASQRINADDMRSNPNETRDLLEANWRMVSKHKYSQASENAKQDNLVGMCRPLVFLRKKTNPRFKRS